MEHTHTHTNIWADGGTGIITSALSMERTIKSYKAKDLQLKLISS